MIQIQTLYREIKRHSILQEQNGKIKGTLAGSYRNPLEIEFIGKKNKDMVKYDTRFFIPMD